MMSLDFEKIVWLTCYLLIDFGEYYYIGYLDNCL